MRKLLLITTALIGFYAQPAQSAPVIGAVSFIFGGAGFGAVTSIWGIAAGTLGFTALTTALRLGASLLLSRAAQALAGKPKQADIVRELQAPTSLPPYRFVYGKCWAPGSPAPVRVKGEVIYACYLLNSRPSVGPFQLVLDKRPVEAAGDPYDFAGDGAYATNAPFAWSPLADNHCRFWIGRGDQVGPPALILAEASEYYDATDGWQGCTVVWLRLRAGGNDTRAERWPSTPPEVMMDGKWSRVWDPRDPAQDREDAATWGWSANQGLCTLDALRSNPLRPYGDRYLMLDTFSWSADVADQPVAVKAGGTIPRYEANGVLVFSQGSELEDQVQPLADAGAARFVRLGGRLGLLPGIYTPPVVTLSDVLADTGMSFTRYRPSNELVTAVCATYTSPERCYEDATTPPLTLAGAQAEDGGGEDLGQYDLRFAIDHRQAQRVAKIMGLRTRCQRTLAATFPPEAFNLVGGATVALDLPAPYAGRNGIYEVEEANPGLDPVGQSGVALRMGMSLRETGAWVYDWTAASDEQDVVLEEFDPHMGKVQPPGAITAVSDASTVLVSGDTMIARALFTFTPSPSASVISYEWQWRMALGLWSSGGLIDPLIVTGDGDVFGYLMPVMLGSSYTIRARALSPGGASVWVMSAGVTGSAGSYLAPAPAPVSAIGGEDEIAVTFRAPNSGDYRAMEIWSSAVDDSGAAVLLGVPIYGGPNTIATAIQTGLGPEETRFYFARSLDRNGQPSPFSASISATTTP